MNKILFYIKKRFNKTFNTVLDDTLRVKKALILFELKNKDYKILGNYVRYDKKLIVVNNYKFIYQDINGNMCYCDPLLKNKFKNNELAIFFDEIEYMEIYK